MTSRFTSSNERRAETIQFCAKYVATKEYKEKPIVHINGKSEILIQEPLSFMFLIRT